MALIGLIRNLFESLSSILMPVGHQMDLRRLAQSLIEPVKSGLHSCNTVSEILLSIQADMVLPGCQTFNDVRRQIMNMKLQMEEAERRARAELQHVDRETETLTAEQSWLAQQQKQKTDELNNLNIKRSSLQATLNNYKEALETERRNLQTAEETLREMRQRRDNAELVRNIGFGVTLIPFAGWVAGPIMIVGGQIEMNQASEAADKARREIANCESQVNSYSNQVENYNSLIHQAERDIRAADNKIRETEAKLRYMSEKRTVVADIQYKVRRAVTQLGQLSGVGSVAELQTQRLILLAPVMNVLEEMTTILGQIGGNELLYNEGIQSLMDEMRWNQRKLKALADTKNQSLQSLADYI